MLPQIKLIKGRTDTFFCPALCSRTGETKKQQKGSQDACGWAQRNNYSENYPFTLVIITGSLWKTCDESHGYSQPLLHDTTERKKSNACLNNCVMLSYIINTHKLWDYTVTCSWVSSDSSFKNAYKQLRVLSLPIWRLTFRQKYSKWEEEKKPSSSSLLLMSKLLQLQRLGSGKIPYVAL